VTAAASSANTTAGVAPVQQVETISVTAASTKAGSLTVRVTAAGMTGTPKSFEVPVTANHDTTAKVAAAIRTVLAADAAVSAMFTVSGTDANIVLTKKTAAANDGTLAIALTNDGSTSVTVGSSTDTTAGVAPKVNVRLIGTGVATTADPFKVSNAYKLDNADEIVTAGKSKAYIYVQLAVTDLRSAPTLTVVPFLKNATTGEYAQAAAQDVTLLTAAGKSLMQVLSVTLDGAEGLKVLIDTISGQGAAATIYVELA
jgi:hypothetical protein